MDYYASVKRTLKVRLFLLLLLITGVAIAIYTVLLSKNVSTTVSAAAAGTWSFIGSISIALLFIRSALQPFEQVRRAILHVATETSHMPAPDLERIKFGRELVSSLVLSVYDMASKAHGPQTTQQHTENTATTTAVVATVGGDDMLNATPLPLFTVTASDTIHFINDAALVFLGLDLSARSTLLGKNINEVLNLSFPSDTTYESWLKNCRENVLKAGTSWERVRLVDPEGNPLKQFDLAASYSKASGDIESVLVLFDHTEKYATDDQEISFVAMAVHELRTPLTIMRGYIEVFEDELGPTLEPELKDFMHKMNASAQQLTAFVSNILNVARVEENQLVLTLAKHNLADILPGAVQDLELRARVHKKHIELQLPQNLPAVAVDRISLHEVINNLVDNAIKYSGTSEKIVIQVTPLEGYIQISVQDFGVGIPEGVVPKLFDKFYRSHRSKVQIGGTGLGLYLCKAIVTAHGGNIWVKTHEGEGSTFSFTLEIYDEAKHGAEAAGSDGIQRGAHGWIKNHSMYRR